MFPPVRWLAALALLIFGCGDKSLSELELERREEVRATLTRRLEHEERMLSLLETHRHEPQAAARAIASYAAHHEDDLEGLAAQRRLLESEPDALASALAELAPRSHAAFSRRRALYESSPALMELTTVKRALSRLDTL